MNTINLKIGTYKNYQVLCEILNEPIMGGNGKIAQFKKWKEYINFEKIKSSYGFVILEIYKYVDIKIDTRNNYKKYIKKSLNEYINFKYNQKELIIIENYKSSKDDEKIINNLKEKYKNKKYEPIVQDLYILYIKAQYSPCDLGVVYHKDERTFQTFFKDNGLSRNLFEAQAIAKNKRDYKQIMNKGRETMIKNQTSLKGSKPEVYTRDYINCRLPLEIPNSEIIVGVNNKSILDNGKEIDIPIIIINNDKIYKFAIEYNGDFWHEDKNKESIKLEMINQKGYHLFYIAPNHTSTDKIIKEYIENQVDNVIIPYIKEIINEEIK